VGRAGPRAGRLPYLATGASPWFLTAFDDADAGPRPSQAASACQRPFLYSLCHRIASSPVASIRALRDKPLVLLRGEILPRFPQTLISPFPTFPTCHQRGNNARVTSLGKRRVLITSNFNSFNFQLIPYKLIFGAFSIFILSFFLVFSIFTFCYFLDSYEILATFWLFRQILAWLAKYFLFG